MDQKLEISNLLSPILSVYKSLSNEWDNFLNTGLSEYLYTQTTKYYYTHTFLHRGVKVLFHEIYFPVKVLHKKLITDFSDLNSTLENYNKICVVGNAGSGKTTLIKYIFLESIRLKNRIPILIELRNLNHFEGDFEDLILQKILQTNAQPSKEILIRKLKSGKFLFLFDGYDEVFSTKKQQINQQIELFVDTYSENSYLITTRPGSGIENFPRFFDFEVMPLDDDEVIEFINKVEKDEEKRNRIESVVVDSNNESYQEYLRNPLLLSMFILAFESHPEIPQRKSAFYRNVFDTLYSKHDGVTKSGFLREKLTMLQRDDFEIILSYFSYLTITEGIYSFTNEILTDTFRKVKKLADYDFNVEHLIYDLSTTISILILDGFEYSFPHRSMQEYFASVFIKELQNIDKKNKAYKKLSYVLKQTMNDNSFNLISLCFELDKAGVTNGFIVPELNRLYDMMDSNDSDERLKSFCNMVNIRIFGFYKAGTPMTQIEEVRLYPSSHYEVFLLDFCGIDLMELMEYFPEDSGCHEDLKELYLENFGRAFELKELGFGQLEIDPVAINSESQAFIILKNHGFTDLVDKIRLLIKAKILELEKELSLKNSNIDEMLN